LKYVEPSKKNTKTIQEGINKIERSKNRVNPDGTLNFFYVPKKRKFRGK
jgi:hypothetical protein